MDPASAVAGLIGLAALTAQTAQGILKTIKGLQQIPENLQRHLRWLSHLTHLLADINEACQTLKRSTTHIDTVLLHSYLTECLTAMQILEKKIESRMNVLQSSERLKRHIARVKAFLESGEIENQLESIRRTMEGISICHSSIIMQGVTKSGDRLAAVERLLVEQMTEHHLFRQGILEFMTRFEGHQNMLKIQMKDVRGGLRQLQFDAALSQALIGSLEQNLDSTANFKRTIETTHSFSSNFPPCNDVISARDGARISNYEEEAGNPHIEVRADSNSRYQWNPKKNPPSRRLLYHWSARSVFGSLCVRIFELDNQCRLNERQEFHTGGLKEIEISWIPNVLLNSRAIQMRVSYKFPWQLSSPTTVQISVPCIRPIESISSAVLRMKVEDFKIALRDWGYGPEDLFIVNPGAGCWSLLHAAINYCRMDIALYLLEQGWQPDKSILRAEYPDTDTDLSYFFCEVGRQQHAGVQDRQIFLSVLRRLLDLNASLSISFVGKVSLSLFDDTIKILLEHPTCIMQYEMSAFRNCVDAITLKNVSASNDQWTLSGRPEENTQLYAALANKYQFNLQATDGHGWTALHTFCYDRLAGRSPGIDPHPLEACSFIAIVRAMIISGANLCAISHNYLTPLLIVILCQSLVVPWFRALAELGINIDAAARHMIRCIKTPAFSRHSLNLVSNDDYRLRNGYYFMLERIYRITSKPKSVDDLVYFVLGELSNTGIHLEIGEWMYDNPKGVSSSLSSGVDLRTSATYDASKQSNYLRKRGVTFLDRDL